MILRKKERPGEKATGPLGDGRRRLLRRPKAGYLSVRRLLVTEKTPETPFAAM